MLKQRIITASFLALVFLGMLFFAPPLIFALFVALAGMVAAWEWANLCGYTETWQRVVYIIVVSGLTALCWWALKQQWISLTGLLILSAGWWAVALLWVQGYPASAVLWRAPLLRGAMGLMVFLPFWFAVHALRGLPDGALWVLAVVLIVAAADIGAYFSGRAFGKHKLAPAVSPGKSWEGVVGGVIAATLTFGLFLSLTGTVHHWIRPALIAIPTALISVVGDLLESMLKRYRGIKDSGHILPGHGGVLDRVDGLAAAVPVFTLALLSSGWLMVEP